MTLGDGTYATRGDKVRVKHNGRWLVAEVIWMTRRGAMVTRNTPFGTQDVKRSDLKAYKRGLR